MMGQCAICGKEVEFDNVVPDSAPVGMYGGPVFIVCADCPELVTPPGFIRTGEDLEA